MVHVHIWDIVAATVSIMVGSTILLGIAVRYMLIPYIRAQLIDPLVAQMGSVISTANIISRAWDGHLDWAQKELDRIDHRLDKAGIS